MLVFSCLHCDCPAFTLPAELTLESEATCVRCRASLGSWGALKRRLEQYLVEAETPAPTAPASPHHRSASSNLDAH